MGDLYGDWRGRLMPTILERVGLSRDSWMPDKTVLGYSNYAYQHIHQPSYIVPDNCSLISATTSATENTFGDFVQAVGADAFEHAFDFHWASVENITENGVYIIEIHIVDDGDLQESVEYLGALTVSRRDNFTRGYQVYTQVPVIPAKSRVAVRAKKSGAGAGVVTFNFTYHNYEKGD